MTRPLARSLKSIRTFVSGLILLAATSCSDRADDYPSRPISIICPWAVGGGTDTCSRVLAATLEEATGVPVNVINRTGGAGVTGHSAGARASRDGYTLLTVTAEIAMMHWRGLTNVSYRDYEPVCLFNRDHTALFVRSDSEWKTLEDLRRSVESSPGKLRASGTALGGSWHLGCAGALIAMNLAPDSIVWVPSTGASPALQELISGGIEIVSCSLPEGRALLEGGEVRALTVMAPERLALFPDVPTLRELGYDWSLGAWRGIALPGGTPPEIVSKVTEVVAAVAGGEKFQTFIHESGYGVAFEDAATFAKTLETDDRVFGELLGRIIGESTNEDAPGPWFFPIVLGIGLVVFGLSIGIGSRAKTPSDTRPSETAGGSWGHFLAVLGAVIFYVFFASKLGFIITAALLVFFLSKRLGARWLPAAVVAAAVSPAIYLLFAHVLRVPLPKGVLLW